MPAPRPIDVDAYIESQPAQRREEIMALRVALAAALPGALEGIAYNMPSYAVDGRAVAAFAAWKGHWALYVVPQELFAEVAAALPGHQASKGIVRFAWGEPLPAHIATLLTEWVRRPRT